MGGMGCCRRRQLVKPATARCHDSASEALTSGPLCHPPLQGQLHVAVAAVHGHEGVLDVLCEHGGAVTLKALHHATDTRSIRVGWWAAWFGWVWVGRHVLTTVLTTAAMLEIRPAASSAAAHATPCPSLAHHCFRAQGLQLLLARGRPPVLTGEAPVHIGGAHSRTGELCVMLRLLRDTAFRVSQ